MSKKFTHFAFIASFLVILMGLNIDRKQVNEFCSNSKTQTEQIHKLELKVDFSTTINVLGTFVQSLMHKLLSTNQSCSSTSTETPKVKKSEVKCIS